MPQKLRNQFTGPTLFSLGFRPFFLLAGMFAACAILTWMLIFEGEITLSSPFPATDWHIHEMLFGYTAAVISGFLFTAIPNWTGRMPMRGWPLAGLAALWLAGRVVLSGITGLQGWSVLLIDSAFLFAIVVMIAIEIIAGRNWRNLMVVVPVSLLMLTNVLFHLEVMQNGSAEYTRRLGFTVVIFLIMLIGGRVIPSFTRNWLAKQGPDRLPVPFNRFDAICLLGGVIAMGLWVGLPEASITRIALLLAAALHLIRLSRWQGVRVIRSSLLLMLHIAYVFIPLGLIANALAEPSLGFHLLGIGAIGGMTMAVMSRATLGHTGRDLKAGVFLSAIFALLILAALTRGFLADFQPFGISGLWLAAILWTLAYGGFVLRLGPWLVLPKTKPRKPNPPKI